MLRIKRLFIRNLYKIVNTCKPILIRMLPKGIRKKFKSIFFRLTTNKSNNINQDLLPDEYVHGINLVGFSRAEMGIGESCRIAATSIHAVNIPFGILNYSGTSSARMSDMTWVERETLEAIYSINVFHVNAEQMPEINAFFGEELFRNRYNIGVWHWELRDFPDEWMGNFNYLNEIWAPSTFIAESISAKSPIPVVKIPHSIDVKITQMRDRSFFNLPDKVFLFLTMYDVRSYSERKNPKASIKAFKHAFEPEDLSVGLVIKINSYKMKSADNQVLTDMIGNYKNIYIIEETLSRNDVNSLLAVTDCFISLHRSEGFGLGLAEAMFLGKPAIGTSWSSTTDFMNSENSCPVNYKLIRIEEDSGPYKKGQVWADPDITHASDYMKKLKNDVEFYNKISKNGERFIKTNYSPESIGEMIKNRLKYIRLWKFGG